MKNEQSCFQWPSSTNEKEVINRKSRRNCQELTERPMLGQHLAVRNARKPHSWSFKTAFNENSQRAQKRSRTGFQRCDAEGVSLRFPPGSPAGRASGTPSGGARRGAEEAAASRAALANGRRARPEARRAGPAGPP